MTSQKKTDRVAARPASTQNLDPPKSNPQCFIPAGLSRRREASRRLPPLPCGCLDPWTCWCYDPPECSERELDGYVDAAAHLFDTGLTPIVPLEVCRQLWRRRGDRALAVKLAQIRVGGAG